LEEATSREVIAKLAGIRRGVATFRELLRWEKQRHERRLLQQFEKANWRREQFGTSYPGRDRMLLHPLDASFEFARVWSHSLLWSKRDVMDNYSRYFDRWLAIADGVPPAYAAVPAEPRESVNGIDPSVLLYQWRDRLIVTAQLGLLQAAAGVQAFHAASGKWPITLDELVPAYLEQVPADPFSPKQGLRYRCAEGRIMLYSVGPDGKDDGGSPEATQQNAWRGGMMRGDIMFPNLDWKTEPTGQAN
jgi:hypothetical protein